MQRPTIGSCVFMCNNFYALVFREYSSFISIDGKHKIKVGKPSNPIASAERGKRVLVRSDEFFSVMDNDFTKFGLVPSVILFVHILEEITDSLYHGMCIFSLTHIHLVSISMLTLKLLIV